MTAEASTAIAERTPLQDTLARIRGDQFKQEIADALPGGIGPDRFVRATVTAIMQNPEVLTGDRDSLFQSVIRCAQDGLMPDGREAALVVFNDKKAPGGKKVQYMPMIGGLRKIAAEHDLTVEAYVVCEHDFFEWELGFSPTITHRPPRLNEPRGEAIGAYAVATQTVTGQKFLEVMSKGEIEDVRKVSRAATSEYGPWVNWWGEMARKTVARRMFKQLPLGDLDEREEQLLRQADVDVDFAEPRMTIDEANVTANLTGGKPPTDSGPDDQVAAAEATPEQHGQLLELVVELTNMDPDVDWQMQALEFAYTTFAGRGLDDLNGPELEQVLEHLRGHLPEVIT